MFAEAALLLIALALALALRPWRLMRRGERLGPLLAMLVLLPWVWALPVLHPSALQLRWSGACLAVLMLGWPLAVPVLLAAAALAGLIAPLDPAQIAGIAFWQGVLPATLALGLGALLRRWLGEHPFVYLLGRAFLGTVACVFAAGALQVWAGERLPGTEPGLALVAHWLMAWGEGIVTGMLASIFVAFAPQWLATWSDTLYLRRR